MPVFETETDPDRQVLRIHFRGHVTGAQMNDELDRLHDSLARFAAGFRMITDLTDLETMELDCVPHVTRMMDLCLQSGVGQVVRVIPDPEKDIGFTLLSLTHYRGKVPIATCRTRTEAERTLAGEIMAGTLYRSPQCCFGPARALGQNAR